MSTEGIGACTIDAADRRSGVATSTIDRHFVDADLLAGSVLDGSI